MFTSNRSTVTRRSAFKLGGIAALAAGLPLALHADDTAQAVTVVNGDDLTAACKRLAAESEAWMEKERAACCTPATSFQP